LATFLYFSIIFISCFNFKNSNATFLNTNNERREGEKTQIEDDFKNVSGRISNKMFSDAAFSPFGNYATSKKFLISSKIN